MPVNVTSFDINRLSIFNQTLIHRIDAGEAIDSSQQKNRHRTFDDSLSHTPQGQGADPISSATVTFALDEDSQELYIPVADRETGEVLREILPGEVRRLAGTLWAAARCFRLRSDP